MDEIIQMLRLHGGGKFDFLRLFDVTLDYENQQLVLTFMYPEYIKQISDTERDEVLSLMKKLIDVNAEIKVKFKKSFLEERFIKKEIQKFFDQNFKSISAQVSDQQIVIIKDGQKITIELHMCKQVKTQFELAFVKKELLNYLEKEFIADFSIIEVEDERYNISETVPEIPVKVEAKKAKRYEVEPVKKLFGKDISPHPEQIKNITSPKPSVILFGKISNVAQKTFIAKKGKRQGEEKKYVSFSLDDGKKIDCVYFSTKSNEKKLDCLTDGLNFLCLGDVKIGLNDKLTYYINSMTLANMSKPPEEDEVEFKEPVALIEDFFEHRQQNLFVSEPKYKEPVASQTIVVYDLETTGLNPETDEIIEIGAIKIEKGKVTKKFSSFIKPNFPIPFSATKINHITNEMVANAPKMEDVILDFYNFCKGAIISGYNNTDFDNHFLRKAYQKLGLRFDHQNLDVYMLARSVRLASSNLKLTSVAAALGIDLSGAHRAYNDAFATAQVLLKLNEVS